MPEPSLTKRYAREIEAFFTQEHVYALDRERGHVWIAKHKGFDTLTVEPPEGGQYEIAVRFPLDEEERDLAYDKYAGYVARDGYMVGRNTAGH
jgi:hypothetical protein